MKTSTKIVVGGVAALLVGGYLYRRATAGAGTAPSPLGPVAGGILTDSGVRDHRGEDPTGAARLTTRTAVSSQTSKRR